MDHVLAEEQRNLDRALRALIILEAGCAQACTFTKNGHVLQPQVALQSVDLLRDLMKLGLFCLNIPISGAKTEDDEEDGETRFDRFPSFFLGMSIHYAITVAPALEDFDPEGRAVSRRPGVVPTIDLERLSDHVSRIEREFGVVPVDDELIARASQLATHRLRGPSPNLGA